MVVNKSVYKNNDDVLRYTRKSAVNNKPLGVDDVVVAAADVGYYGGGGSSSSDNNGSNTTNNNTNDDNSNNDVEIIGVDGSISLPASSSPDSVSYTINPQIGDNIWVKPAGGAIGGGTRRSDEMKRRIMKSHLKGYDADLEQLAKKGITLISTDEIVEEQGTHSVQR